MSPPVDSSPRARRSAEHGFALVEVLVSAVLLLIMSAALFTTLDVSGATAGQDRQRQVASALGRSQQQQYRAQQNFADTTVAPPTLTSNPVVGKGTYHVVTTGTWVSDTTDATQNCATVTGRDGAVDYLKLHTVVTWTGDSGPGVSFDTLVAPPVALTVTTGTVVIRVLADGVPRAGINVTLGARVLPTNAAGCVVFGGVPAGSTTGQATVAGMTDDTGATLHVDPAIFVTARQVTRQDFLFFTSLPKTVTFNTQNPTDPSSPSTAVVATTAKTATFTNASTTSVQGDAAAANVASLSATLPSGTYNGYAGSCTGNDPTQYGLPATPLTGASTALRVPTLSVRVQVVTVRTVLIVLSETDYAPANDFKLVITPDTTTSGTKMSAACLPAKWTFTGTDDASYGAFGTSTATAAIRRIPLPYGTYKMCVSYGGNMADNIAVTNKVSAGTLTAVVPINGGGSGGLLGGLFGFVGGLLTGAFPGATSATGTCS